MLQMIEFDDDETYIYQENVVVDQIDNATDSDSPTHDSSDSFEDANEDHSNTLSPTLSDSTDAELPPVQPRLPTDLKLLWLISLVLLDVDCMVDMDGDD